MGTSPSAFTGEEPLNARLDLGCEEGQGFNEALLRQTAEVHLEEVGYVAHESVQFGYDDPNSPAYLYRIGRDSFDQNATFHS